ncbi:MAG: hypothetical protein ACU841_11905 [Gammaproteobacteria bacterium]
MKTKFLLFYSLLWFQPILADTGPYRFSRPIVWQDSERQELLAVALDSRIYAATRDGFPDLRLIDDEELETPYLLEKAVETQTETRRLSCDSTLNSLKKKGKSIEIYLTLDKDVPAAEGLTVVTPLINFQHRLQIFGSNDGKHWSQLVKDAEIFDYTSHMKISHRDIALPDNHARQFKVVVEEAAQIREGELLELKRTFRKQAEIEHDESVKLQRIPLKIDRIEFWRTETDVLPKTAIRFDYPVAGFEVTEDAESQTTAIEVVTAREPLTGFRLQSSTSNFNRTAVVQIQEKHGIDTSIKVIGRAALESLRFRDIDRVRNEIGFSEHRRSNYRIVISNQDNPPLAITSVTGIGNGYHLLFLPQKGKSYHLRYGSDKASRPSYDTGPIRELLRRGYQGALVKLGEEMTEDAMPPYFDLAELLNSRVFLGMAAVIMVIALGWSLVRVGKRIDRFPEP